MLGVTSGKSPESFSFIYTGVQLLQHSESSVRRAQWFRLVHDHIKPGISCDLTIHRLYLRFLYTLDRYRYMYTYSSLCTVTRVQSTPQHYYVCAELIYFLRCNKSTNYLLKSHEINWKVNASLVPICFAFFYFFLDDMIVFF